MVIIRLSRSGAKKNPYYFITVADSRKPRDGAFIERLGFYNPLAQGQEEVLRIDHKKIDEWIEKGAQLSDRVKKLLKDSKLSPEDLEKRKVKKKEKADAKKAAILAKQQEELKAEAAAETPAEEEPAAEAAAETPAEEEPAAETPAEEEPAAEAAVEEEEANETSSEEDSKSGADTESSPSDK